MRHGAGAAGWVYGGTIALGAALLFAVEPMAAKELLPVLGGSSAVWLTALCFFQVALLLGYGYAHWAAGTAGAGRVHVALLAAATTSLLMPKVGLGGLAERHPALAIFAGLTVRVGLPFFVLATTSPLLQAWFARATGRGVPYRWYAVSNACSLLALVLYPLVVERALSLRGQRLVWGVGFGVYAVVCGLVSLRVGGLGGSGVWREGQGQGQEQTQGPIQGSFAYAQDDGEERATARAAAKAGATAKPTADSSASLRNDNQEGGVDGGGRGGASGWWGRRGLWFVLPAVGAMQLCAVTGHLTQNVAAIPLLWVVPLAVYLLSFAIGFEFPALYRRPVVVRVLLLLLASLGYLLSKVGTDVPIGVGVSFFVLELFAACWFLHAELYRLRPEGVRAATRFYLMIAAGGAAGTMFVAVVSPMVFRSNYDVALAFAATAAAALLALWDEGWQQRMLWGVGVTLSVVLVAALRVEYGRDSVVRLRNFYGSLRVREAHTPAQAVTSRTLVNGSIQHGMQWFAEDFRKTPMTYYAEDSGVGLAMRFCCGERPRRVGVVGLGAGTIAAYGRAGDQMEFYEINPQVTEVARGLFTYMRESGARVSVVPGDARLSLSGQPPQGFDVLVVDAFSGDAIPVHLLTREAMALYRRHMRPGGVIAFHVSNQYLDLPPVVAKLAEDAGMRARVVDTPARGWVGEFAATWVLVSERGEIFEAPEVAAMALPVAGVDGVRVWTDDYSSLWPAVRWGKGMAR